LSWKEAVKRIVVAGMLTRPAGHEAKAEARKSEAGDKAEAQKFFEAEARHVREQLSVYEHED